MGERQPQSRAAFQPETRLRISRRWGISKANYRRVNYNQDRYFGVI